MRRERIIKAVNNLREALHAAQIRELLRVARTGQQADSVNRTQRILLAYNDSCATISSSARKKRT